jgi:uncharacterized RDD family membrane protein YckC
MSTGPQEPLHSPGEPQPDENPRTGGTPPGRATQAPGQLLPRFGARIIDSLIIGIVGGPLGLALDFGFVWVALQAVLVFAYFVLLDTYVGTTAGKRLLGLRVIGPTGAKPEIGQAANREAFTLLGAIPYIGGLLGLIAWIVIAVTINSSPTRQGKHDEFAGGTQVVKA